MKAPIFLFFVFYLLTSSCESTSRKKQPTTTQPPEIEVAHPLQRAITYSYQYPAYLQAEQTVNIVARVSGNLNKINYTPGMQVKQGQLLFVIDPQPYIDQLQAAEAQTKNMQAKLNYAQKQYEKMKEAMPSKAISEIDFIQAESD